MLFHKLRPLLHILIPSDEELLIAGELRPRSPAPPGIKEGVLGRRDMECGLERSHAA